MNSFFKLSSTFALLFMIFFSLGGCTEKDVETYQDDSALYFRFDSEPVSNPQYSYIAQSFFLLGTTTTYELPVYVRINGLPKDYDRPIKIVQTNSGEEGAAVAGLHYVPFDDERVMNSFVVKAGEVETGIKIIVTRYENSDDEKNNMALHTFSLKLRIEENEHFKKGVEEYQEFEISMTSMASKPLIWDTKWYRHFGPTWGTVKMLFIIDVTGYTEWEVMPKDVQFLQWMKDAVNSAFNTYNHKNPGNPLREADGTLVQFN